MCGMYTRRDAADLAGYVDEYLGVSQNLRASHPGRRTSTSLDSEVDLGGTSRTRLGGIYEGASDTRRLSYLPRDIEIRGHAIQQYGTSQTP